MNLYFIVYQPKSSLQYWFSFPPRMCGCMCLPTLYTAVSSFSFSTYPFTQFDWHRLLHNALFALISLSFNLLLLHLLFSFTSHTSTFRIPDFRLGNNNNNEKTTSEKNSPMSTKTKYYIDSIEIIFTWVKHCTSIPFCFVIAKFPRWWACRWIPSIPYEI